MGNKSAYTDDILASSGNLFSFDNAKAETRIDITHDKAGGEIKTLRIRSTEKIQTFNYKVSSGLFPVQDSNSNVLTELFSLKLNEFDKINSFFQKYGFFIPISNTEFETFSYNDIFGIIVRIHTLLQLIQELQKDEPDCNRLYKDTTKLQLNKQITIKNSGGYEYATCKHFLRDRLEKTDLSVLNTPPDYMVEEEYSVPYAHVPDSMNESGYFDLAVDDTFDQQYEVSDLAPYLRNMLASIFDCDTEHRRLIELYCHLENSRLMSVNTGSLNMMQRLTFEYESDLNLQTKFPDLKQRLIEAAQITIKDEIEYSLSNIRPVYDAKSARGSWHIPDLLSALYFSIFYMRPDLQLLRLCENPYCDNYFSVTSTKSNKKYCCHECANAVSQRAYRNRNRQN